jgi:hypothetical protein
MMRPTLLLLALLGGPALAQTLAPPPPPPQLPVEIEPIRGEPQVQRSVVEDGGSRVEELRVRGNTTRISVTPKVGGTLPYEILTEDGSRDVSDGLSGSRGAAGKRVWRVLSF